MFVVVQGSRAIITCALDSEAPRRASRGSWLARHGKQVCTDADERRL